MSSINESFVFIDAIGKVSHAQRKPDGTWALWIFQSKRWIYRRVMTEREIEHRYAARLGDGIAWTYHEQDRRTCDGIKGIL